MREPKEQKETELTRRGFFGAAGSAAAAVSLAVAGGGAASGAVAAASASPPQTRPSAKKPFELGVASYTFRKFKIDQALAMTKRVGLSHICLKSFHLELNSKPDEIARVVAQVKEAGINLYGGGVITMRNEADINQAFEYAKAAGMKTIIAAPTPEVLALVDKKVQQYGIRVAIHNHGPGDKIFPTPQSAYEKIKDLDKRIGLCIDVGHTIRIGADPIRSAEQYADRLLDFHIKDVSEAAPTGKETEVGRGVVDVPQLVRTLVKINYTGIVAFEYEKDADDPLAGLAESVGYVRGVMAAI